MNVNILHLHLCKKQTLLSKATYIAFKLQFYITFMHLADAFIQSDLHCI